jgi:predicted amidohydrolase
MSQGDAGAANIDSYVERTIQPSRVRVIFAINLSRIGEATKRGCLENLDDGRGYPRRRWMFGRRWETQKVET